MELPIILCLVLTLPNGIIGYAEASEEIVSKPAQSEDLNARLTNIEALLQATVLKNAEFETRIEALEDENRQLRASVRVLQAERDDGEKSQGAETVEEGIGTGSELNAKESYKSKDRRRSSRVPRILLSDEPTVAFTATISIPKISGLGKGQTIKYDHVVTNVGGAYHAVTGMFTAPATGVYVFNYNTMVEPGDNEYLDLMKNGQWVVSSYAHGTGESRDESTSMTVTLQVKQGDEVWVQTANSDYHGTGTVHGNGYSTFSGWILAYTE